VGPGAEILLKSIEPFDPSLQPKELTTEQWIKLANAFHQWHFKPDVLADEGLAEDDSDDLFIPTSSQELESSQTDRDDENVEIEAFDDRLPEITKGII
jgi:hypothetical protein